MRASIAAASASAASPSTATKAPISSSNRSIRSSAACTSSRADMARVATCSAIAATVMRRKSTGRTLAIHDRAGGAASPRRFQQVDEALEAGDPAALDQHGVAVAERPERRRASSTPPTVVPP